MIALTHPQTVAAAADLVRQEAWNRGSQDLIRVAQRLFPDATDDELSDIALLAANEQ